MKTRLVLLVILLVVLVAVGLGTYAWKARPQLVEITPKPGETGVEVTVPIHMVFSKPMRFATVMDRLQIEPAMEGTFSWDKNVLTFTPARTWPGGQEISLALKAGSKAATWLAFPMESKSWTFKTSLDYLAYLWPSDGPADLYALNPITGEIDRYTRGMGVLEYSVSRDGIKIYFAASNPQGGSDLYQIDRMRADTSMGGTFSPIELLDCGLAQCRSPVVSPDGKYLAYEYLVPSPGGGLTPAQIWLLSLQELNAIPVGQATHETVQPAWSTSGWLAYYDRTAKAYEVTNPQTKVVVQLPNQTGQPGNWSPDGKFFLAPEISYSQLGGNHETGISHLIRYGIPSGTAVNVSGSEEVEDVEGYYSPDGKSITFTRKYLDEARWSLGRQIWIMKPDGSNPHPITEEPDYNHYDLSWSRDGLMLAYVRFNQAKISDPPELWMINADGSDPVQLVMGGYSPQWIP